MTRGIYLGTLLICVSLTLHVCWASHEGSWDNNKPKASLWHSQDRAKSSRPQGGFRQANKVKDRSSNSGTKNELFASDKYYLSSQTNPRWQNFYGSSGYVQPKKSGQFGGSVGNLNQNIGVFRTLHGQQGTQRIGQYAPSKPSLNSPKVSSQHSSAWKPHSGTVQRPGSDKKSSGNRHGSKRPEEFMKSTSGLAYGYKVNKGDPAKYSSLRSPVVSSLGYRFERPISYNLGPSQSYSAPVYNREDGSVVHNIPYEFGGYPIRRPGDEEPVKQIPSTGKPKTTWTSQPQKPAWTSWPQKTSWTFQPQRTSWARQPAKIYTLPPRTTEPYRTRPPKPHRKSKWIQVLSYKLAKSHGVPVRTL